MSRALFAEWPHAKQIFRFDVVYDKPVRMLNPPVPQARMTPSQQRRLAALNRRLWWVSCAVAFVGLAFACLPTSQLWTGTFNDSDDYMRLARVFDWLNGQGWYDLAQRRLSPDTPFMLPWSRLVDLPLAACIWLAEPWVGRMAASGVAGFMVPLVWLGSAVLLLPLLGRGLVPARRGWVLIILLFCSFALLREWRPMRVDHHGPQLFLALGGLLTLVRYVLQPAPRWRFYTGVVAASGLAIGAESFFWLGLAASFIGAVCVRRHGLALAFWPRCWSGCRYFAHPQRGSRLIWPCPLCRMWCWRGCSGWCWRGWRGCRAARRGNACCCWQPAVVWRW
jgi:hypothetical protein